MRCASIARAFLARRALLRETSLNPILIAGKRKRKHAKHKNRGVRRTERSSGRCLPARARAELRAEHERKRNSPFVRSKIRVVV